MSRKRFSVKDRARIFAANDGCCHLCGGKIDGVREAWEIEHVIAWELTRDDSDTNLRPAHKECHKRKTHGEDRPAIQKAKNRQAKFTGAKKPEGRIKSKGFAPPPDKPARTSKPLPPRRSFYVPAGSVYAPPTYSEERANERD